MSTRLHAFAVCGLLTFSGSVSAGDIADLVVRAERTTRPNEDKQPPRCQRNQAGEIVALNLDQMELKVGDIAEVAKCGKLESLSLIATNITNDQLKLLVEMKSLRSLRLNQTAVSDAGLKHLGQMKPLKYLCLGGVDATPEGVKQLKHDLPGVQLGYYRRQPKD